MWRDQGVAFELREDTSYEVSNRSLVSGMIINKVKICNLQYAFLFFFTLKNGLFFTRLLFQSYIMIVHPAYLCPSYLFLLAVVASSCDKAFYFNTYICFNLLGI